MKKIMKKLISLGLSIALLFCAVSLMGNTNVNGSNLRFVDLLFHANAATYTASGFCGEYDDNVRWTLDDTGMLTISGYGAMKDYNSSDDVPWASFRSSITSIIIKNGVTCIGYQGFIYCDELTSVTIPNSVTSIGASAFYMCSKLPSVIIPNSITQIGASAFHYCRGLTFVTIPDSVNIIGMLAFAYCDSLKSVAIGNGVKSIEQNAFSNCFELEEITVGKDNTVYFSKNNCVIDKKSKTLVVGCKCSVIPTDGSVTSIGVFAFDGCSKLTSITIPGVVKTIGGYSFYYCRELSSVVLGNGVANIECYAFYSCFAMTSVIIPESVTSIDNWAFDKCVSLSKVYYAGTQSQWNKISIGTGNDFLKNAEIIFNATCYSVQYHANGGIDAPSAQIKIAGNALKISTGTPTKSFILTYDANGGNVSPSSKTLNCTFNNWNATQNGSGTSYAPGEDYNDDANVTLYAQWTNPLVGTLATPTRNGYIFDGWYTAASGGRKVTDASTISSDVTLYAHWTEIPKKTYTVKYDANGGNGAPADQMKTEGTSLTIRTEIPSKSFTLTYDANGGSVSPTSKTLNCTFNNWNTVKDGSGTSYTSGASYTKDAAVTLYAQWTNPKAGTLATPTRNGCTFDGWYTAASGGSKVTDASTISADTTLYAHWTEIPKKTYTVKYDANGGAGAPANQTKTEGTALTISFTKPTKSFKITYNANGGSVSPASKTVNCTFNNWNTAKNGSGMSYASGSSYTNDAAVTLYAQWANPKAGTLATPTRNGCTFDGWYTAASGGSKVTDASTISADTTLYAHWTEIPKKTYTVKYDANGGSGAPADQTKTEGTALTISSTKPTKSFKVTYNANGGSVSSTSKTVNCTFENWNTAKNGSGTSYASGASYAKNAAVTLYAQWTNPKAETLATPNRSGYNFDGWYTTASGGSKVTDTTTISADTTIYAHWNKTTTIKPFMWGTDNWNFVNSSYTGDFSAGTYRSQIDNDYLRALARNLTNEEFQVIFYGTYYSYAWLDELFTGSCYGMSSTTLLAKEGLLPYSQYKSGATRLNQLNKPTANRKVSSLITYYQMLQVKDVIQQQYRSVPYRTNETNIKELLSLLDEHSTVLVGFKKNNWGAHAVLAYGYEYGSYTYNGVTYQGCIKICDPNASKAYDASYNIYFNTQTYSWAIPAYRSSGISSANGAVFTYIGANVKAINQGGYLSGSSASSSTGYIARIDAAAISDNRSVSKVQKNTGGSYSMMNAAPDDIVEDYSYVLGNESKGTIGYNLKDGDSAYTVTQSDPVEMRLTMDYEDCYFAGSSAAGKSITFDKNGYVEVNGESSEFTISMTFNDDHPTDWFTVQVKGNGSNHASLQKDKEGYVITADDLTKTEVKTNNRTDSAEVQFSTEYKSALIYEVDSTTIGIKVDTDNNGTYETVLKTDSVQNALGDVDNDGQITPADARLALRVSVKLEKEIVEGTAAYKAADVDKDGDVTPADARTILRVSVNLESF